MALVNVTQCPQYNGDYFEVYTVCAVLTVLRMCSCIKHSKHLLLSDELSCIMQINADVTDLVRITQMMYHPPGGCLANLVH